MTFENGAVSEDWRPVVIVPLYDSKGERNECKMYRVISFLRFAGKIYAAILLEFTE